MSKLLFADRRVLWMDPKGVLSSFGDGAPEGRCCAAMGAALVNACPDHADDPFACPDMVVAYSDTFDEYGLIVHDGGASYLTISFCPFCGAELPRSRRDDWFDRLEAMGIDDPSEADIPESFRSGAWRRATGH